MSLFEHQTVLLNQLVSALNLKEGDSCIDCTAGGGGHTTLLLDKVGSSGLVKAFDQDSYAVAYLKKKFSSQLSGGQLQIIESPFSRLPDFVSQESQAGICADIGVSSPQIDSDDRGFSFLRDGPLDMRMDQSNSLTAAEVIRTYSEAALADLFFKYGEEPKARILARLICERREQTPFERTKDLADFIDQNIYYKGRSRTHKATRAFQALRIEVNNELGELESLLASAPKLLRPGGRLAIITFHSLEDRLVKHSFKRLSGRDQNRNQPRHLPLAPPAPAAFKIVKPFPLYPEVAESESNPRARSAKLRIIEKI